MSIVPYVGEAGQMIEGSSALSGARNLSEALFMAQQLRGLYNEFGTDAKYVASELYKYEKGKANYLASGLRNRLKRLRGRTKGRGQNKKKSRTGSMARSKRSVSRVVKRGGVSKRRVQTARSKPRKKKTSKLQKLERRVKKLSVAQPPKNVAFYQNASFLKLSASSEVAGGKFFEIVMSNKFLLDNPMNNLPFGITDTDFTTENSELLIRNFFSELELVNAVTANMHLEYMFVKSKGDSDVRYIDFLHQFCSERLDPLTYSVVGNTAATATASAIPARITLKPHETYVPITGGFSDPTCEYKQVGKVHKLTLGPGDHHKMSWSAKNIKYKQEAVDNGSTYSANYTVHLIVKMYGDIAHDVTNTGFVTRMDPSADCLRRQQFEVVYYGGSGIKTIERETSMDTNQDTAVSQAVQADNYQSGVFHADS